MNKHLLAMAIGHAVMLGATLSAQAAVDTPVQRAKTVDTRAAETFTDQRRVQWGGWATTLDSGASIGTLTSAADCQNGETRAWNPLLARRVGAELQQAFDDELARAAFSPRATQATPLEVSAVLNDFTANLCSAGHGQWQGQLQVQVSWKVKQAGSQRVVHQMRTKGVVNVAHVTDRPPAYALRDAFAKAARNLITDRRFVAMVQPTATVVATND
jgi:hypothetical protein